METLLAAATAYGPLGLGIGVLIYYMSKILDQHREERKEWSSANNDHVDKFATVIAENTRALTEMKTEVRENRCKMKN